MDELLDLVIWPKWVAVGPVGLCLVKKKKKSSVAKQFWFDECLNGILQEALDYPKGAGGEGANSPAPPW